MPSKGEVTSMDANSAFKKTKMCKFHVVGKCTKGECCPFAHNVGELNDLPDLRCTKLCKNLLKHGECTISGCSYAHNKKELRANVEISSRSKAKPHHSSERTGGCALLSKCNTAPIPGGPRDFVNDPVPQPRKPHPAGHLQPPPGLDIPGQHTSEKNGSNISNSALQVKEQIDLNILGHHAFEKEGSYGSRLGDPKYVQPSASFLHMSNYQWPSIIEDRPVLSPGTCETDGDILRQIERYRLTKLMHFGWSSQSTLCSLGDLVEL